MFDAMPSQTRPGQSERNIGETTATAFDNQNKSYSYTRGTSKIIIILFWLEFNLSDILFNGVTFETNSI